MKPQDIVFLMLIGLLVGCAGVGLSILVRAILTAVDDYRARRALSKEPPPMNIPSTQPAPAPGYPVYRVDFTEKKVEVVRAISNVPGSTSLMRYTVEEARVEAHNLLALAASLEASFVKENT